MAPYPTSTIGQLFFADTPDMCFARLVSELDAALASVTDRPRLLGWDHDDIAIVDFDGARIVLGYSEDVPGRWAACLTVSVGHGPREGDCPLAAGHAEVAQMIVARLTRRVVPAETRWLTAAAVVDSDLVDALIDTAADMTAEDEAPAARPAARPADAALHGLPEVDECLVDLAMTRVEEAMSARRESLAAAEEIAAGPCASATVHGFAGQFSVRRPAAEAARRRAAAFEVACDMPDLPRARCADAARIRAALYDDDSRIAEPDGAVMRLSAHAVNATLLMVSLPVGASLMTYSLLRGENLMVSARTLAVLGAFVGMSQIVLGIQIPMGM